MSDRPLFAAGKLGYTPAALAKLEEAGRRPMELFARHAAGDWGNVDAESRQANDDAIAESGRLHSVYQLDTGVIIWVVTEADRSATTILLPEED
jgi:hypothetical protein